MPLAQVNLGATPHLTFGFETGWKGSEGKRPMWGTGRRLRDATNRGRDRHDRRQPRPASELVAEEQPVGARTRFLFATSAME
ncbi:MAG: hypothetical protein CTY20_03445 [Hyphomicrobium sp.]|nr:MAG: hypothetical protein CTY20_03445 [Hyphomicrobium sp.]